MSPRTRAARRDKEDAYPELVTARRCELVVVAEETGVGSEEKKLLKEQLKGMNHSNQVHDLAYST